MLRSELSCGRRGLGVEQCALAQLSELSWPFTGFVPLALTEAPGGEDPRVRVDRDAEGWGGCPHLHRGQAASGTHVCPSPPFVTVYCLPPFQK